MANVGIFKQRLGLAKAFVNDPELVHSVDKNGWTPLHFAAASRRVEMAKFLLSRWPIPTLEGMGVRRPSTWPTGARL